MAKTVIGLFDDFTQAQQVVRDLVDSGFRREDVSLIANDATKQHAQYLEPKGDTHTEGDAGSAAAKGAGIGAGIGGVAGLVVGLGALAIPGVGPIIAAGPIASALAGAGIGAVAGGLIGALTKMGVPEEEAHYYAEGVRRGGTVVAVKASDERADEASAIMRRHNPIDLDRRAATWRDTDWERFDEDAEPFTETQLHRERERYQQEERIPVVEEEMQVGKREVERGGVRVHTWVEEVPVSEHVSVRDEEVHVDRRQVDRPLDASEAADAFKERTVEMTETDEEVVAQKQARVKEEVVVSKDVQERTETVQDTVRRTHVDVDEVDAARTGAMGAGFESHVQDFRNHYRSTFGPQGGDYDRYEPAYRYGYELAGDRAYQNLDWNAVEPEARRTWEQRHRDRGAWDEFKGAVRHAWERARH